MATLGTRPSPRPPARPAAVADRPRPADRRHPPGLGRWLLVLPPAGAAPAADRLPAVERPRLGAAGVRRDAHRLHRLGPWEVGLDWWQLVPRLALWFGLGVLLLLPWTRRGRRHLAGQRWRAAGGGAAGRRRGAAQPVHRTAPPGRRDQPPTPRRRRATHARRRLAGLRAQQCRRPLRPWRRSPRRTSTSWSWPGATARATCPAPTTRRRPPPRTPRSRPTACSTCAPRTAR